MASHWYISPYFSLFFPERLPSPSNIREKEDIAMRRKIRTDRPIPLKVSPMENRWRCWLPFFEKKLRNTTTEARKELAGAYVLSLSLSSSFPPFSLSLSLSRLED